MFPFLTIYLQELANLSLKQLNLSGSIGFKCNKFFEIIFLFLLPFHRVNIIHLARMNTDCKYMEEYICDLNRDIRQAMVKKFGMSVNLDELQETILNRFAFMIRSNFEDIKKEYAKKVEELKVCYECLAWRGFGRMKRVALQISIAA